MKRFALIDREQNTKMYDLYHHDYHWVDGWSIGTKENNFHRMMHLEELTGKPIEGTSCLDVGCGTGDLSLFLRNRGIKNYLGVDIYEPSLENARRKYPHETFLSADILADEVRGTFDYIFCSGALTVRLKTVDNYDFLEAMIEKMWHMTKRGMVFNVLTTDPNPDPDLFFYDIDKVTKICKGIIKEANSEVIKNSDKQQAHFYLWR